MHFSILQIQYFMEAAKLRNFSKVAKAAYVSQPSVTKQICDLEKEFGFSLFERNARGVSLTPQGEILYNALLDCKNRFENAYTKAKQLCDVPSICIGLQTMLDTKNLISDISSFLNSQGTINFSFKRLPIEALLSSLNNYDVDIAYIIDTAIFENSDICHYNLFSANDYVLTCKGNDLINQEMVDNRYFKNIKIAVTNGSANTFQSKFGPQSEICKLLGFSEDNVISCDNFESCFSTTEHSNCVIIIDDHTVFPNKENYNFYPTGISHNVSIAWRKDLTSQLALSLINWLRNSYK